MTISEPSVMIATWSATGTVLSHEASTSYARTWTWKDSTGTLETREAREARQRRILDDPRSHVTTRLQASLRRTLAHPDRMAVYELTFQCELDEASAGFAVVNEMNRIVMRLQFEDQGHRQFSTFLCPTPWSMNILLRGYQVEFFRQVVASALVEILDRPFSKRFNVAVREFITGIPLLPLYVTKESEWYEVRESFAEVEAAVARLRTPRVRRQDVTALQDLDRGHPDRHLARSISEALITIFGNLNGMERMSSTNHLEVWLFGIDTRKKEKDSDHYDAPYLVFMPSTRLFRVIYTSRRTLEFTMMSLGQQAESHQVPFSIRDKSHTEDALLGDLASNASPLVLDESLGFRNRFGDPVWSGPASTSLLEALVGARLVAIHDPESEAKMTELALEGAPTPVWTPGLREALEPNRLLGVDLWMADKPTFMAWWRAAGMPEPTNSLWTP